jgi:hypothetical protein
MKEQKFSPNSMQQIPTAHTTMLLLRLLLLLLRLLFPTAKLRIPFPKNK